MRLRLLSTGLRCRSRCLWLRLGSRRLRGGRRPRLPRLRLRLRLRHRLRLTRSPDTLLRPLRLNSLLSSRVSLLLCSDHLLASSCPLRLLLLNLLPHTFALRLLSSDAFGPLLFRLLPLKLMHLLPGSLIAASGFSVKIRHLPLSCLLGRNVRSRGSLCLLRRRALILELQFLISQFVRN